MTEKGKELIKEHYSFEDLVDIVAYLRSDDGCPWDRAQTHESVRKNLIEECYEVIEGIDRKNDELLCEELGDLLLQILFHARMAQEEKSFSIDDVVNGVAKKMIARHPHVFGERRAADPAGALERWEEIKKAEKSDDTLYKTLDRVARTLPSPMRTQKLLKKAGKFGVDAGGQRVSAEELTRRYMQLCADANASGADLEELAYAENEAFVERYKDR